MYSFSFVYLISPTPFYHQFPAIFDPYYEREEYQNSHFLSSQSCERTEQKDNNNFIADVRKKTETSSVLFELGKYMELLQSP